MHLAVQDAHQLQLFTAKYSCELNRRLSEGEIIPSIIKRAGVIERMSLHPQTEGIFGSVEHLMAATTGQNL
jgi:hypothetical protein